MKRSKLFLGITSGLLAVVGVAAAKAHFNNATVFYLTDTGTQSSCTPLGTRPYNVSGVEAQILQTTYGAQARVVFQTITCLSPVYIGAQ